MNITHILAHHSQIQEENSGYIKAILE